MIKMAAIIILRVVMMLILLTIGRTPAIIPILLLRILVIMQKLLVCQGSGFGTLETPKLKGFWLKGFGLRAYVLGLWLRV